MNAPLSQQPAIDTVLPIAACSPSAGSRSTVLAPEFLCRLSVASLRPHPLLQKHSRPVKLADLGGLAIHGDSALDEPLVVTENGGIVAGLDRWEYARYRGILELPCKVLRLTPEDTVIWMLRNHQPMAGLNQFTRILIALELEDWLEARAKSNQQHGGELKGLSNLAEAAHVDVRSRLAKLSGTCPANVDKVRLLCAQADLTVVQALKMNEISIHRAWQWAKKAPDGGRALLAERKKALQIQTTLRKQTRKQRRACSSSVDGLLQIRAGVRKLMQVQGAGYQIGPEILELLGSLESEWNVPAIAIAAA